MNIIDNESTVIPFDSLQHFDFEYNSKSVSLCVTNNDITVQSSSIKESYLMRDAFYFSTRFISNDSAELLIKIYYFHSSCCSSGRKMKKLVLTIYKRDTNYDLSEMISKLNDFLGHHIYGSSYPTIKTKGYRQAIVIVNPIAGDGSSLRKYREIIKPLLEESVVKYTEIFTTGKGHCYKYFNEEFDPKTADQIIIVSGDGLIHEYVNGIMNRNDADRELALTIPFSSVMAGSGCGLSSSVCHVHNLPITLENSILYTLKGNYIAKDIVRFNYNNTDIYSFLVFTWGFVADVDFESEQYRCIGDIRFPLQIMINLCKLRLYEGTLWYWIGPLKQAGERYLTPLNEPLEDDANWARIDNRFVGIVFCMTPLFTKDMGIDQRLGMNSAKLPLLIFKESPRYRVLRGFLNMMNSDLPFESNRSETVEAVYTPALRLKYQGSYIDIDGEKFEDGNELQMELISQKLLMNSF